MQQLIQLAHAIDNFNAWVGRWVSWAIVASILISAINAIVRKVFNISSNAWLEVQWYLFGLTFLLASAWTLQRREHIRIDIVFNRLPKRLRHWIELLGHLLFLMPFVLLIVWLSWATFGRTVVNNGLVWNEAGGFFGQLALVIDRLLSNFGTLLTGGRPNWEFSNNTEGLALWPAYLFVLLGFFLLALQGVSEIIKHVAVMRGILPEPKGGGGHGALDPAASPAADAKLPAASGGAGG
jgi:TRAP-type mannitol/chloroaromatic compound transport system permease small subunit